MVRGLSGLQIPVMYVARYLSPDLCSPIFVMAQSITDAANEHLGLGIVSCGFVTAEMQQYSGY